MQISLKKWFLAINMLLCTLLFISNCYAQNTSPVGIWRTYSDVSGNASGVVQISEVNGMLYGKIVKIYPVDGNKPTDLCVKCTNAAVRARLNKPILGMTFLWGLKYNGSANTWDSGWIFDPKVGKIYRCKLNVTPEGNKLNVRGYIGISLLGRTQTWERISKAE